MLGTRQILRTHGRLILFLCAAKSLLSALKWPVTELHCYEGYAWASLLLGVVFAVSAYLVQLGLLRSASLDETEPRRLAVLLRSGAHFFWRQVGLGLVLLLVFLLIVLPSAIVLRVLRLAHSPMGAALSIAAVVIAVAVVLKAAFLVPAIILVVDCPLAMAFRLTRFVPIMKAGRLWLVLGAQVLLSILGGGGGAHVLGVDRRRIPVGRRGGTVSAFLGFLIYVEAMRHVVNYGITADRVDGWTGPAMFGRPGA